MYIHVQPVFDPPWFALNMLASIIDVSMWELHKGASKGGSPAWLEGKGLMDTSLPFMWTHAVRGAHVRHQSRVHGGVDHRTHGGSPGIPAQSQAPWLYPYEHQVIHGYTHTNTR